MNLLSFSLLWLYQYPLFYNDFLFSGIFYPVIFLGNCEDCTFSYGLFLPLFIRILRLGRIVYCTKLWYQSTQSKESRITLILVNTHLYSFYTWLMSWRQYLLSYITRVWIWNCKIRPTSSILFSPKEPSFWSYSYSQSYLYLSWHFGCTNKSP